MTISSQDEPHSNNTNSCSATDLASEATTPLAQKHFLRSRAKALYRSEQVYAIEQAWFDAGYDSFALMQQAAWQMTQKIINDAQNRLTLTEQRSEIMKAAVWVGTGNNGGDGWLIAHYLSRAGWQVQVVDVGLIDCEGQSDASKARQLATHQGLTNLITIVTWDEVANDQRLLADFRADYHIDALFGIGFDRAPSGKYQQAIDQFNHQVNRDNATAISVDIPSGIVASTGQVFADTAIKAHLTLCLVAPKLGLYIKDAMDYTGEIIDIALIPYVKQMNPSAWRLERGLAMSPRLNNSHKGSFGHVLIIGGRQSQGSQGMGGAAILATGSALVSGAGKVTTACERCFHGAVLSSHPNAMTVEIDEHESVDKLIESADVVAIGMGIGRDETAFKHFKHYLSCAVEANKPMVIDADGLYHLASLSQQNDALIDKLKQHTKQHQVCFTPHSGEAARLLEIDSAVVEADRLNSIQQCANRFGGDWLLKGAGSLVLTENTCYVCSVGNAGMASAGMGDVLSGLTAGLMAQQDLPRYQRSLFQAVLIHGLAGDIAIGDYSKFEPDNVNRQANADIGLRALQAQDMIQSIGRVMQMLSA